MSARRFDASLPVIDDARGESYPFRKTGNSRPAVSPPGSHATEGPGACRNLRKSTPANTLLPRTVTWFESLPPRVRPVALRRQFPRIANLIAADWADLIQFETYMDSLLNDKRGGRKGFPGDVLAELAALDVYRHTVKETEDAMPWIDVGKRD